MRQLFVGQFVNIIVGLLIIFCVIPVQVLFVFGFLVLLCFTLPYRLLVSTLAKLNRPHLIEIVQGQSGLMAVDPLYTRPTLNLLYFFVLDGVIPLHRFQEIFSERIINKTNTSNVHLVYGKFQQYWVNFMGYNFWEWDPEFKIENHINLNMDFYTTNDLPKLMSDLLPLPFKKGQSPWEITLLHNYSENWEKAKIGQNGPGRMTFILKIHHTLADGFSLLNVFQRDLPLRLEPLEIAQPQGAKLSIWRQILQSIIVPWEFNQFLITSYDPKNKWLYPTKNCNKGQQKYYTSITSSIEVSKVCEIKNKYNVSYLAVLVHCVFEGVRVAMENGGQSVPDRIGFKFTRAKPNHPGGLNNHVYPTMVVLPMQKAPLISHLQTIESILKKEKMSMLPIALDALINLMSLFPTPLASFFIKSLTPPGVGCSNFPVPRDVTSIEGCHVTDLFVGFGSFHAEKNVIVMMFGDGGKQSIVIHVDESSYSSQSDFEKLGDYIKKEFITLASSCT